jgi:hypothetical protein
MAGCVEGFDIDRPDLEGAVVAWCFGHFIAVATTDYR